MRANILEPHHKDQNEVCDYCRMVVPDCCEIRNLVIPELHEIPFMGHPRVSRTICNVRTSFFWKGMAGDIGTFVEACPACQLEKSDHTMQKG